MTGNHWGNDRFMAAKARRHENLEAKRSFMASCLRGRPILLVAMALLLLQAPPAVAQVSFDRIQRASEEPQNWLTYSGTYASHRYSLLTQIDRDNVKNLQLKWVWRPTTTPADEKMENTPIVVDGVLYATSLTEVVALDAATGGQYWKLSRPFNPDDFHMQRMYLVNKGVAI